MKTKYQHITLELQISTTEGSKLYDMLLNTMLKYSCLCNMVSQKVFNTFCKDRRNFPYRISSFDIHNLKIDNQSYYHYLRKYTHQWDGKFPSTILIQVFKEVSGSYNTILTNLRNIKSRKRKNQMLHKPIVFNKHGPIQYNCNTLNFKLFDPSVVDNIGYGTLSTINKRMLFYFIYGEYVREHLMRKDAYTHEIIPPWKTKQYIKNYIKEHGCRPRLLSHKIKGTRLVYKQLTSRKKSKRYKGNVPKGTFFLQVTLLKEIPPKRKPMQCLGVDVGITNLATTSTGTNWTGSQVDEKRIKHSNRRRGLQKAAKAVKSKHRNRIYRKIKKLGSKEYRFHKDVNHRIAKCIVDEAKRTCSSHIILEKLTGIREQLKARRKQRSRMHGWAYAQLHEHIQYKAALAGIEVIFIDPKYTSQRCNSCGHTERSNRGNGKNRERFMCKACNYTAHADHNAAINIRDLGYKAAA